MYLVLQMTFWLQVMTVMVRTMTAHFKKLQTCRQVNLKLNKDKCHFRCTSVSFVLLK